MAQCPVCCEAFTVAKRAQVTCAYCDFVSCTQCQKQYILSSLQDAHCMNCRRTWSRDVLGTVFTPSFLNGEYKKHRERVLLDRERALLPESQDMVANYRRAREIRARVAENHARLVAMKQAYNALATQCWRDRRQAERLEANNYRGAGGGVERGGTSAPARPEYVAPCLVDECRGFVSASSFACGTCETVHCKKCGKLSDENHACTEDDIASFKAVLQSTKACPKCAVRIYKTSGCDQM